MSSRGDSSAFGEGWPSSTIRAEERSLTDCRHIGASPSTSLSVLWRKSCPGTVSCARLVLLHLVADPVHLEQTL